MNVLIINCGSSSLKFQLIKMADESVLVSGLCERIGIDGSRIVYKPHWNNEKIVSEMAIENHQEGVQNVLGILIDPKRGVIKSLEEISAIGHRVVHGGEVFSASTLITEEVIQAVKDVSDLAPLHNPANLIGIEACGSLMPGKPQVAVFDTAFHQTMDEKSYLYAIPYEYYTKHKIRRYGFHGTSHKYVAHRTADFLGRDIKDMKMVVCHLGNGASVCAVDGGKSVDTSMGLTPLEGLMMGTRSGDLDPAIVQFIARKEGLSLDQVVNVLNKESGAKGLSGVSSDFRDITEAIRQGDNQAKVAMEVYKLRIAKYIGAYAAEMNGLDAIVFTAGIGENDPDLRKDVCSYLSFLGAEVDDQLNMCRGQERDFSAEDARVKTLVIPTNEELMIAKDTMALTSGMLLRV